MNQDFEQLAYFVQEVFTPQLDGLSLNQIEILLQTAVDRAKVNIIANTEQIEKEFRNDNTTPNP